MEKAEIYEGNINLFNGGFEICSKRVGDAMKTGIHKVGYWYDISQLGWTRPLYSTPNDILLLLTKAMLQIFQSWVLRIIRLVSVWLASCVTI